MHNGVWLSANCEICEWAKHVCDKLNTYLTTKETWHILCVNILVVNEYDAHLSFHCVKLNKGSRRCSEIIWKDELISDVSYQTSRNP